MSTLSLLLLLAISKPFPIPDSLKAADKYGCHVNEISQRDSVDVRDVSKPSRYWIVKVFAGLWMAELPKFRLDRKSALHDCDQWMKMIDREVRKQRTE